MSSVVLWFLRLFAAFRAIEQERDELERRRMLVALGPPGMDAARGTLARAEGEVHHALLIHTPAFIPVVMHETDDCGLAAPFELHCHLVLRKADARG